MINLNMKKYLMIIALLSSIASARFGIFNDVIDVWDSKMNAAKQGFGNVVDFGRKIINGQDKKKRSKPDTTDGIAYKVHDVATAFSMNVEKVFQGVKTKTINMYNNVKGLFGKNLKATPPSGLKHKGDEKRDPVLQKREEIDDLYQNTTNVFNDKVKDYGSFNSKNYITRHDENTSNPKSGETDVTGYLTLTTKQKSEKGPEHTYQNKNIPNVQSDEVANTSLKRSSNSIYMPFLDLNDYNLQQVNHNSQTVKVKASSLQHSSSSKSYRAGHSTLENTSNLQNYEIATSQLQNNSNSAIMEIKNVLLQNMTNLINDTTVLKSVRRFFEDFEAKEKQSSDSKMSISEENIDSLPPNKTPF